MKLLLLVAFLLLVFAKEEQLRIGVKFKPDTCEQKATKGKSIQVHYTGRLKSDGSVFDSSVERGDPFTFTLGVGQVIKGWDHGVEGMCVGEKRKLTIPSHLAYGERGAGQKIPGGATLVFDVELIKINQEGHYDL